MGSLYLCSKPSIWSGAARLLDFGNTFDAYNHSATGPQADALGLLWDWAIVGNDLWQSMLDYEHERSLRQPGHDVVRELAVR
jgi:hypothetical protein